MVMSKERGIDISTWQGNVDFNKVKASGIQFLILRSSYRQTVDGRFHGYVKAAKIGRASCRERVFRAV